jgi:hypothetical protein
MFPSGQWCWFVDDVQIGNPCGGKVPLKIMGILVFWPGFFPCFGGEPAAFTLQKAGSTQADVGLF